MTLRLFETHEALSLAVANEILQRIQRKPTSVICLATGDTPLRAYQLLAEQVAKNNVDVSQAHFVALDEWAGVPPSNPGSCRHFLTQHVFTPLAIKASHIHLFDALAADIRRECAAMNDTLKSLGGIDLMIVGIGMNGHVGFNEPGVPESNYAHVIDLDEITQSVGQKYFSQPMKLSQGITMGWQNIFEARTVILMANGQKKADIMKRAVEEPISNACPATLLRKHADSYFFVDALAASKLA
ncbi:MAG: glucosamine-6-phosphate deaminase [Bacteroidetes bacterium]|nr:glucosamine-6-phosphate deaminase [Bacteroidota bacterium]